MLKARLAVTYRIGSSGAPLPADAPRPMNTPNPAPRPSIRDGRRTMAGSLMRGTQGSRNRGWMDRPMGAVNCR